MAYTLADLRALVEETENLPDHVEVRLATQPNYPFENSIVRAKVVDPNAGEVADVNDAINSGDLTREEVDQARARLTELEAVEPIIYLCEGRQLGYASRSLWDEE